MNEGRHWRVFVSCCHTRTRRREVQPFSHDLNAFPFRDQRRADGEKSVNYVRPSKHPKKHIKEPLNYVEGGSQLRRRTLIGLVSHKPAQKFPTWILRNAVHKLDPPCEVLVCDFGVHNVLSYKQVKSTSRGAVPDAGSYLAYRLLNL